MRRWASAGFDHDPTLLDTPELQDDQQQQQRLQPQQPPPQFTDLDGWTPDPLTGWTGVGFDGSIPDASIFNLDFDHQQFQQQQQAQPPPQQTLPFDDAALLSLLQQQNQQQQSPHVPDNVPPTPVGPVDLPDSTVSTATTTPSTRSESTSRPVSIHGAGSAVPPKVGTRFSRESLRILRNWLAAHASHPFPTDEEREVLERQTGLTKTQILNWMANARRRGKMAERARVESPRARSPSPAKPTDIPRRPGTPAPRVNPLDRWVDSPPEDEPAAAAAIARAMAESSPSAAMLRRGSSAEGSEHPSSGAGGTSCSSSASAYSFESRESGASVGKISKRQRRPRSAGRRRRTSGGKEGATRRSGTKTPLVAPSNTFQCTFCTDTFSSKHTWQRHEKSLHLPLERWVCAPNGPRRSSEMDAASTVCVFCDLPEPDDNHIAMHNYDVCRQRCLEDRTFHRKDHLGQHLRLVHNLAPEKTQRRLAEWKMERPVIRSVCGFCSASMDSWEARADHLAEHFKMGSSMADWQGEWGFEPHILARVEHSLAPYMIAHERNSPYPFAASKTPVESPRTAYEILKLELMIFVDMYFDRTGRVPSSDELQFDACRIVFTAELPAYGHDEAEEGYSSWLRDLVLSSDSVVRRARLNPLRPAIESRLSFIGVIGKKTPFESCPFEAQLASYVEERRQEAYPNELFLTHQELQAEACRIMRVADKNCVSAAQSDIPTTWLENLAQSSTEWLDGFCARYGLPMTTPSTSLDTTPVDSFLDNYNRLSENLVARLEARDADPTDAQLRQQMLLCILECDASPEWKAAAVSSHSWLARFKRRNFPWSEMYLPPGDDEAVASAPTSPPSLEYRQHSSLAGMSNSNPGATVVDWAPKSSYFLNDPNFDRSVPRELARWVAATMSPNNPNQHVPTDLEVQNQARWIMFGDHDPFNQTIADYPEWLTRFKREVGILNDRGPGLSGLTHGSTLFWNQDPSLGQP